MKNLLSKCLRFLRVEDGPTAMESAFFFAAVVLLCLISIKMSQSNLAAELPVR